LRHEVTDDFTDSETAALLELITMAYNENVPADGDIAPRLNHILAYSLYM
jgi:hypothetical protein